MKQNRLQKQMAFLVELENLKKIYRQNVVIDGSRHENSAEHSWHVAMMAIVLSEHADEKNLDILKILKMLLIHDIVEIDAGDTFLYDEAANMDKEVREEAAAARIFGLLPEDQRDEFISLWREFDARQSPEAAFAASLDGMQPVVNHCESNGAGIKDHQLSESLIVEKKMYIQNASRALWDYTLDTIRRSVAKGLYR
ncbi:HD domain-containing protein [Spirochaeta dissipatitropha]